MSALGKGVKPPKLVIEHGAELEGWRRFTKRFEIALIGAGLQKPDSEGEKSKANTALKNRRRCTGSKGKPHSY